MSSRCLKTSGGAPPQVHVSITSKVGEFYRLKPSVFAERLPRRMPQSFESFLARYSFPAFDVLGITLFGWDSDLNEYAVEASAPKNSLSELLIPVGYVQIGRPDTGDFDAICFDLTQQPQDREYRIVQVDHEDILCNWKVRVTAQLWPSFIDLVQSALSSADPRVFYEAQTQYLPKYRHITH